MNRTIVLTAAILLPLAGASHAQDTGKPRPEQKDAKREARLRYHSAQAALHSALSHAEALEAVCEESGKLEADIALSHVKTVNRDANECNTNTVKMGQALHSLEKKEDMKTLRSELAEAIKAADKAHNAVDGHGEIVPPAKETTAHLRKALAALKKLSEDVGVKPLPPPVANSPGDSKDR